MRSTPRRKRCERAHRRLLTSLRQTVLPSVLKHLGRDVGKGLVVVAVEQLQEKAEEQREMVELTDKKLRRDLELDFVLTVVASMWQEHQDAWTRRIEVAFYRFTSLYRLNEYGIAQALVDTPADHSAGRSLEEVEALRVRDKSDPTHGCYIRPEEFEDAVPSLGITHMPKNEVRGASRAGLVSVAGLGGVCAARLALTADRPPPASPVIRRRRGPLLQRADDAIQRRMARAEGLALGEAVLLPHRRAQVALGEATVRRRAR